MSDFENNFFNLMGKASYLLERDKPKMVRYEFDGYADGNPVCDMAYCPNCDRLFDADGEHYNFCPECGQRLKWED